MMNVPQVNSHLRTQIQGHSAQMAKLGEAIHRDRLPHALFFVGPEGVGKQKVAFALAQKLLCEQNTKDGDIAACGQCASCVRVAKHQSENVMLIQPEGQNIKIDQARQIMHFLSLANFGRNRVVIIDQAHLMNPQAANSILKILEEPSDRVYFILIAPEAESMMSTIRSRSQVIRFSSLGLQEMKAIKPGLPEWVYKCSRGQMTAATALSGDEGTAKRLQSFEWLTAFWEDPDFISTQNHSWRSTFKDREEAQSIIKNWILIMRDVLIFKLGQLEGLLNADQVEKIKGLSFLDNSQINFFISQLLKIEKEIQGYVDSTLLIESLWVKHARK